MIDMLHAAGTVGLWLCAIAATLFVALYHLTARWWRSEEGWHVMTFTASLALAFGWVTYRTATTPSPVLPLGEEIARAAIYCGIAGCLIWRLLLLWRRQIAPAFRKEK